MSHSGRGHFPTGLCAMLQVSRIRDALAGTYTESIETRGRCRSAPLRGVDML